MHDVLPTPHRLAPEVQPLFKVVQRGGVYTGLSKGARGILFPDNSDKCLAVEDRKNTK
jgi:hypothetical protein